MRGLRSTVEFLGFYVSPAKYKKHPGLYVMGKEGIQKVGVFSNEEQADLFLRTLEQLFEQPNANWDLIGPCENWRYKDG